MAAAGLLLGLLLLGLIVLVQETSGTGLEFRERDQLVTGADTASAAASAHRLGQSFHVEHANLSSVGLQLKSFSFHLPETGHFRLLAGTGPAGPEVVSLPLSSGSFADNPYLTFHFPPLAGSAGHDYTILIETTDPLAATLAAHLSPYDAYSGGAALLDGQVQPGDLSFRTLYTYTVGDVLGDLGRAVTEHLWLLAIGALFLLLPGMALATLLGRTWSGGERLIGAVGLTLLAWPLLLLAGWTLNLGGWGPWLVWLVMVLGAGVLLPAAIRRKPRAPASPADGGPAGMTPATRPYWVALAGVLGLTLFARLVTLRDLVAGMGLDAYHHTLVTQLFLDHGGVPHDYLPYAPLASFTYHFGFHAFAAALGWLAPGALPVERLMPVAGQIATALPVLTLALFGARVLGNRWIGLVAGALAGVVAIFPGFYVNWSRYTQGLGLALLPVAWVVLFDALAPVAAWRPGRAPLRVARAVGPWRTVIGPVVLAAIAAGGLFLTHYRIAAMFATYAVLFLGGTLVVALLQTREPARWAPAGRLLQNGLLVGLLTLLALLPWIINLRSNFTRRFAGSADAANAAYYDLHTMLGDVGGTSQLGYWSTGILLGLAAVGFAWALARRDWPPVLLAVWFALHLLWSNPTLLHLPGAGYVDTVTVVTSAFLPVCLLAAYPLVGLGALLLEGPGAVARRTFRRGRLPAAPGRSLAADPAWRPAAGTFLAVCAGILGLYSAARLLPILDVRPYVTPQDLAAMHWIAANTPATALIAGNGFGQLWGPEAVQGSDAGVWVPLLAHRASTLPPVPAYNERADDRFMRHAVQIVRATTSLTGPDSWDYLRSLGITHLYAGSRGGVLDPALLLSLPQQVQPVFHQDDVWVFALQPGP